MSNNNMILHCIIRGICKTDTLSGFLICGIELGVCFFPACMLSANKYGQNTTSRVVKKGRWQEIHQATKVAIFYIYLKKRKELVKM